MARHGNDRNGKKIRRYSGRGMAKHAQSGKNGRPRRDRMLEARARNAQVESDGRRKAARRSLKSNVAELFDKRRS